MKAPRPFMIRGLSALLLLVGLQVLSGCMQPADFSAVKAQREKAVLGSDTFQSASSNGRVLVAGTASGALVSSADAGRNWSRQRLASPASVIALTACADGSFIGLDFYRKVWIGDAAGQQWSARPGRTT